MFSGFRDFPGFLVVLGWIAGWVSVFLVCLGCYVALLGNPGWNSGGFGEWGASGVWVLRFFGVSVGMGLVLPCLGVWVHCVGLSRVVGSVGLFV